MAAAKISVAGDPKLSVVLLAHTATWVPGFLARAALGLTSVVVVSATPDGEGSVALASPMEASGLLKSRGDTKGSARVAGTPSPGTAWCIGFSDAGPRVWAVAMTPILTGGG